MKLKQLSLTDVLIIEQEPQQDNRGFFSRLFCQHELQDLMHDKKIMQINRSMTRQKGALRGMHFQYPPKAEAKMITCLKGSIFDVIIDLRQNSDTFLKWHGEILFAENMKMLYIPKGFAHGFQTLEENCELLYLHTEFYSPDHEGAVRYNDPKIRIKWPLRITDISKRDEIHPLLGKNFSGIVF